MKRKSIYGLLLAPVVLFVLALAIFPIFRMEFVHNVRGMMGYEEQFGGNGLTLAPGEDEDPAYAESADIGGPLDESGEGSDSSADDGGDQAAETPDDAGGETATEPASGDSGREDSESE